MDCQRPNYIDIMYHLISEKVESDVFTVVYCSSNDNPVYILTNLYIKIKFDKYFYILGLYKIFTFEERIHAAAAASQD